MSQACPLAEECRTNIKDVSCNLPANRDGFPDESVANQADPRKLRDYFLPTESRMLHVKIGVCCSMEDPRSSGSVK